MSRPSILTPESAARRGIALPPARAPKGHVPRLSPYEPVPLTQPDATTAVFQTCDAQRMILAGGDLLSLTLHPDVIPFERLYRRLPEEGMFNENVSPNRPFFFELGAFQVPEKMILGIYDLRPDVYRMSGLDAGDFVPVEERRFSSIMGFDITVDQRHRGNVVFQVDPVAIQATGTQAFAPPNKPGNFAQLGASFQSGDFATPPQSQLQPQSAFNIAAANSFGSAAGAGTALMPQRPTRYGALSIPFTLFAKSSQVVQVRCVIFRPVPAPIAFIEFDLAGVLIPSKWEEGILTCIEPTRQEVRGPGGRRETGVPR